MKNTTSLILLGIFALALAACGTVDPETKQEAKLKIFSNGDSNLTYTYGDFSGKINDQVVSCSYIESSDHFKVEIYLPETRPQKSFRNAATGLFIDIVGLGIPELGEYTVKMSKEESDKTSPVYFVLPPTVIEKPHSFKLNAGATCTVSFSRVEKYKGHLQCDSLVSEESPGKSVSVTGDFTCHAIRLFK